MVYSKEKQNVFSEVEENALITEEQINIIAKDIRDYMGDGGNFVSYNYLQNQNNDQRDTAITNIFGDGRLKAIIKDTIGDLEKLAKGIVVNSEENAWIKKAFEDIAEGKRKLFILTPQAIRGDYGIPILSEYFEDIKDEDVIYKKSTYEGLRNSTSNWPLKYISIIENTTDPYIKNKWHFADYARIGELPVSDLLDNEEGADEKIAEIFGHSDAKQEELLTGLYNTHKGGSVSAFVEYIPLPWKTFVPKNIGQLTDYLPGAILYQPSTGKVYEVIANSDHITANTMLSLTTDNNKTNQYKVETIYAQKYQDQVNETFGNSNSEDLETTDTYFSDEAKAIFGILKSVNTETVEAEESDFNSENSFGATHTTIRNRYETMMIKDKDDTIQNYIHRQNMVKKLIKSEENNTIYYKTYPQYYVKNDPEKTENITEQSQIPKTIKTIGEYLGTTSAVFENNIWQGSSSFRPIINEASPRVYYHTGSLDEAVYGEEIVREYPKGAMALHCIERGTINAGNLWKFNGKTLYSGGDEYPESSYQKLIGYNYETDPVIGDYIYNPYSSELRVIDRPKMVAENGSGRKSYLTKKITSFINAEIDGENRAGGTYLRGCGINYLVPTKNETENINKLMNLPDFIRYAQEKQLNGNNFYGLNDYINKFNDYHNNILNDDEAATKIVFNTLYILPDTIQKQISNKESIDNAYISEIRFKQLNHLIPGDFIIGTGHDNNMVYNLYQITKAPYLYDIFKDYDYSRQLFINIVSFMEKNSSEDFYFRRHDAVLRDILINELENPNFYSQSNNLLIYHYKQDTSSDNIEYLYEWDATSEKFEKSEEVNLEGYTSIKDWLEAINKEYSGIDPDAIYKYRLNSNNVDYLRDLRQRLLTNLYCPIAVNAAPIASLPLTINIEGEGSIEINPGSFVIPDGTIEETKLSTEVSNKINNFKILIAKDNYTPSYSAGSGYYFFINAFNHYNIAVIPYPNDLIICNQELYQIIGIDTYPYTKKIGSLTNKTISYSDLNNELQAKIDKAYIKPSQGIPEGDLQNKLVTKIDAPNMRYLMDYETITYDSNIGEYIFNSTNKTESRKNYKEGSLILSPSNDIFKMDDPDTILPSSSTPTFVQKITNDNEFTFTWSDSNNKYEIQTNQGINHSSFYFDAEEIIKNNRSLILNFIGGEVNGYQITGGILTSGWPGARLSGKSIILPFLYRADNTSSMQIKNLILYYNYDGSNQFYIDII